MAKTTKKKQHFESVPAIQPKRGRGRPRKVPPVVIDPTDAILPDNGREARISSPHRSRLEFENSDESSIEDEIEKKVSYARPTSVHLVHDEPIAAPSSSAARPRPVKRRRNVSLETGMQSKKYRGNGEEEEDCSCIPNLTKISCPWCHQLFDSNLFERHKTVLHDHTCSTCGDSYTTSKDLVQHQRLAHERGLCPHCWEAIANEKKFASHVAAPHNEACTLCSYRTQSKVKLEKHIRNHRKVDLLQAKSLGIANTKTMPASTMCRPKILKSSLAYHSETTAAPHNLPAMKSAKSIDLNSHYNVSSVNRSLGDGLSLKIVRKRHASEGPIPKIERKMNLSGQGARPLRPRHSFDSVEIFYDGGDRTALMPRSEDFKSESTDLLGLRSRLSLEKPQQRVGTCTDARIQVRLPSSHAVKSSERRPSIVKKEDPMECVESSRINMEDRATVAVTADCRASTGTDIDTNTKSPTAGASYVKNKASVLSMVAAVCGPKDKNIVAVAQSHPLPPYQQCSLCHFYFESVPSLQRHLVRQHKVPCVSPSCPCKFLSRAECARHVFLCHPDVDPPVKIRVCDLCREPVGTNSFQAHSRIDHSKACSLCNLIFINLVHLFNHKVRDHLLKGEDRRLPAVSPPLPDEREADELVVNNMAPAAKRQRRPSDRKNRESGGISSPEESFQDGRVANVVLEECDEMDDGDVEVDEGHGAKQEVDDDEEIDDLNDAVEVSDSDFIEEVKSIDKKNSLTAAIRSLPPTARELEEDVDDPDDLDDADEDDTGGLDAANRYIPRPDREQEEDADNPDELDDVEEVVGSDDEAAEPVCTGYRLSEDPLGGGTGTGKDDDFSRPDEKLGSATLENPYKIRYRDLRALHRIIISDTTGRTKKRFSGIFARVFKELSTLATGNAESHSKVSAVQDKATYFAVRNVLDYFLEFPNQAQLAPLSNIELSVAKYQALLTLIKSEAPLAKKVSDAVGEVDFERFRSTAEFYAKTEPKELFIRSDILDNIRIYHKVRNVAAGGILDKINVFNQKAGHVLYRTGTQEFIEAVRAFKNLVAKERLEQMRLLEQDNFAFPYLTTILLALNPRTANSSTPAVTATPPGPSASAQTAATSATTASAKASAAPATTASAKTAAASTTAASANTAVTTATTVSAKIVATSATAASAAPLATTSSAPAATSSAATAISAVAAAPSVIVLLPAPVASGTAATITTAAPPTAASPTIAPPTIAPTVTISHSGTAGAASVAKLPTSRSVGRPPKDSAGAASVVTLPTSRPVGRPPKDAAGAASVVTLPTSRPVGRPPKDAAKGQTANAVAASPLSPRTGLKRNAAIHAQQIFQEIFTMETESEQIDGDEELRNSNNSDSTEHEGTVPLTVDPVFVSTGMLPETTSIGESGYDPLMATVDMPTLPGASVPVQQPQLLSAKKPGATKALAAALDLTKANLSGLEYTIPHDMDDRLRLSTFFKAKPGQMRRLARRDAERFDRVDPTLPPGFLMYERFRFTGRHIDRDFMSPDQQYAFRSRTAVIEYIKLLDIINCPTPFNPPSEVGAQLPTSIKSEEGPPVSPPRIDEPVFMVLMESNEEQDIKPIHRLEEPIATASTFQTDELIEPPPPQRDVKDYVDSTMLVRLLNRLNRPTAGDERQLVLEHIGNEAFNNFQVLARQFDNQFVIISDLEVKKTYFTVMNLVECGTARLPVLSAEVLPLSNLALAFDKCQALVQVIKSEKRMIDNVASKFGKPAWNRFLSLIEETRNLGNLFILRDVEFCINIYHKIRNLVVGLIHIKLSSLHSKLKSVQNRSATQDNLATSLRMLQKFLVANELDRINLMENTNFNLSFLKKIVELVSRSNVVQIQGTTFTCRPKPVAPKASTVPVAAAAASDEPSSPMPRITQVSGSVTQPMNYSSLMHTKPLPSQETGVPLIVQNMLRPSSSPIVLIVSSASTGTPTTFTTAAATTAASSFVPTKVIVSAAPTIVTAASGKCSAAQQISMVKVPTVKSDYKRLSDEVRAKQGRLLEVFGIDLLKSLHADLDSALSPKAATLPNPRYMAAYYNLAHALHLDPARYKHCQPLTNAGLETKKIRRLREFIGQHAGTRELLEGLCPNEYRAFISLAQTVESSQLNFVISAVADSCVAYHRVRNIAVRDCLRSLEMVGSVLNTIVVSPSDTADYVGYVTDKKLAKDLSMMPAALTMQRIEDMGFDFGFLRRILNYWNTHQIRGTDALVKQLLPTMSTGQVKEGAAAAGGCKCQQCGLVAGNLEELTTHYAVVHLSVRIYADYHKDRYGCGLCGILFGNEPLLVKHVAIMHDVVTYCVKSTKGSFPCSMCPLMLPYKIDLFEHYKTSHGVQKSWPEMTAITMENLIPCSKCSFVGSLENLKLHCVEHHFYSEVRTAVAKVVSLNSSRCLFCPHQMLGGSEKEIISHYADKHNFVLRFITVGEDVSLEASCRESDGRQTNVFIVPEPEGGAGDGMLSSGAADDSDPLATPPQAELPIKTEPGELERDTIVMVDESGADASGGGGGKSVKKQDTLKLCPFCKKKILFSKYVAHVTLSHLSLDIKREMTKAQSIKNMPTFRCPGCAESFKGQPLNDLVVHFASKHSRIFQERAGGAGGGAIAVATTEASKPHSQASALEASDNEENVDDPSYQDSSEEDGRRPALSATSTSAIKTSPWVEKFAAFCRQKIANPEARQFIDSHMTIVGPAILDLFLGQLTRASETIVQLGQVVRELEAVSSIPLAPLTTVRRHLLLVDYVRKCEQERTTVSQINPMHIVIFLSQLLGRPEVRKEDLHWLLIHISRLHQLIEGQPVGVHKKITDFFEVIQSPVDIQLFDKNVKQCRRCQVSFDTYKELNSHVTSGACNTRPQRAEAPTPPSTATPSRRSSDSSDCEIYIPKDTGTRTAGNPSAFRCTVCSFTFKTEAERASHVAKVHPAFSCETCNKTFTSRIGLKVHVKHAHTAGSLLVEADHLRNQLRAGIERMGFNYETTSKIFQLSSPGQGEFSADKIRSYLEAHDDDLGPHVGRWLDHVERYRAEYENPEPVAEPTADELDRTRRQVRALSIRLGFNSTQMMQRINEEVAGGAPIKEWEYVYFEAARKLPTVTELRVYTTIKQFCQRHGSSDDLSPQSAPMTEPATITLNDADDMCPDAGTWTRTAERLKARRKARDLSCDDVAQEINRRYRPIKPLNGKLVWNVEKMKEGGYRRLIWDMVVRWLEEEEEKKTATADTKPASSESSDDDISEEDLAQLSSELRTLRYSLDLSQEEVAVKINQHFAPPVTFVRRIVSQLENKLRMPKMSGIFAAAKRWIQENQGALTGSTVPASTAFRALSKSTTSPSQELLKAPVDPEKSPKSRILLPKLKNELAKTESAAATEAEDGKTYQYFCIDCEGCSDPRCLHLEHPRYPLDMDIASHLDATGHSNLRKISGFMSLQLSDVAYDLTLGGTVRKQWKELVLTGDLVPLQFSGKRCKWANCHQEFDDAVEAFKHIRDTHISKERKHLKTEQESEDGAESSSAFEKTYDAVTDKSSTGSGKLPKRLPGTKTEGPKGSALFSNQQQKRAVKRRLEDRRQNSGPELKRPALHDEEDA